MLIRVQFVGGRGHPDHPRHSGEVHQFVAFAGLSEGQLIIDRRSLAMDENYPLKTILTQLAGINPKRLPGGRYLLQAIRKGVVDTKMMEDVLRQHFEFLRDLAQKQAKTQKVTIKTIVLTYPNYLCANE